MNAKNLFLALVLATGIANSAHGQGDFFWSFSDLNSGATNSKAVAAFGSGESGSLFLYYTTNGPSDSDLDTGCFLDISTSIADVVNITNSVMFDADVDGDDRWAVVSGGAISSDHQSIDEMRGFSLPGLAGVGVADATTGLDDLYDASADAFLFGRIDFVVVGEFGPSTTIVTRAGAGGIVHNGQTLNPVFGNAVIVHGYLDIPGDVNGDCVVNLDDVAPFIELLSNGGYLQNADINQDGVVNLLDVAPFVDLLVG